MNIMDNFKQYIAKRIANLKVLAKEKRDAEKQEFLNKVDDYTNTQPTKRYLDETLKELDSMQVDEPIYNLEGEKLPF